MKIKMHFKKSHDLRVLLIISLHCHSLNMSKQNTLVSYFSVKLSLYNCATEKIKMSAQFVPASAGG